MACSPHPDLRGAQWNTRPSDDQGFAGFGGVKFTSPRLFTGVYESRVYKYAFGAI
jgi:hypothetical protein